MKYRYAVTTKDGPDAPLVVVEPLGEGRYTVHFAGEEPRTYQTGRSGLAGGGVSWSLVPEGGGAQRVVDVLETSSREVGSEHKLLLNGETRALQVTDERDRRPEALGQAGGAAGGALRAPMPGKVVKVLCQPGDRVKAGQGLLIIEAMKMENELRAPADGVVREVRTQEGATVDNATVLVLLGERPA